MKRHYIYARVSTDEQDVATQVQECLRVAESQGVAVDPSLIYVDEAVSGTVPFCERPGGGALWTRAERGDVIYIAKLDRAFRSIVDCVTSMDAWGKRGVTLVVLQFGGMPLDMSTPIGSFLVTVIGAVAQLERDLISERTKESLSRIKREGKRYCRFAGYGFRWRRTEALTRKLKPQYVKEVDPEERALMKMLTAWRAQKRSYNDIRQYLAYSLKIPNKYGREWTNEAVRRLVLAEQALQEQENRNETSRAT